MQHNRVKHETRYSARKIVERRISISQEARESRNGIRQCRASSIRGTLTMKTHAHAYGHPI